MEQQLILQTSVKLLMRTEDGEHRMSSDQDRCIEDESLKQ